MQLIKHKSYITPYKIPKPLKELDIKPPALGLLLPSQKETTKSIFMNKNVEQCHYFAQEKEMEISLHPTEEDQKKVLTIV